LLRRQALYPLSYRRTTLKVYHVGEALTHPRVAS
jgi:hypothetical protein